MPTKYVSALTGDDLNDGSTPALAKATITAARNVASDNDTIEIIDEQTYTESNIGLRQGMTLTHTASALGRPVVDGAGSTRLFSVGANQNITLNGIECKDAGGLFYTGGNNRLVGLTIQDCFIHDIGDFSSHTLSGTFDKPITINQSSFFFRSDGSSAQGSIRVGSGVVEIKNCFFSSSDAFPSTPILEGFNGGADHLTASFSTFIYRNAGGNLSNAIIRNWGKVINCVVTSSDSSVVKGIQALEHSYNLVDVPGDSFVVFNSTSAESAGTGDIEAAPTFVDGATEGDSYSIVANFALAEGSRGIDEGITFDSIAVDITGTIRPQNGSFDIGAFEFVSQDPEWTDGDGTQTYQRKFGSNSFEIHRTANTLATRTFAFGTENRQAPLSVTVSGPATIRRRTTPYKTET